MGNCLKTQLKESVNNSSLLELNTIKFNVLDSDNTQKPFSRLGGYDSSHPITLCLENGNVFDYGSSIPLGKEVDRSGDTYTGFIANGNQILRIKNKYNLGYFGFNTYTNEKAQVPNLVDSNFSLDLSEFEYCTHLISFYGYNNWTGNITKLGKCININKLELRFGTVYGDISDLVNLWIDNGRSSTGSILIEFVSNGIHFGTLTDVYENTLHWDARGKMYIIRGNNVYYIGDYDETAMTAAGQPWEGKTPIKCN